jgi:hypothetical protein
VIYKDRVANVPESYRLALFPNTRTQRGTEKTGFSTQKRLIEGVVGMLKGGQALSRNCSVDNCGVVGIPVGLGHANFFKNCKFQDFRR